MANRILQLSDLNGSNGFVISGVGDSHSNTFVSTAGDINNDGIDDLVIGAYGNNGTAGQSYVIFGGATVSKSGQLKVSDLNGSNGFVINGIASGDRSGYSVSNAGDVNNDGIDDLIVGAYFADSNDNNIDIDVAGESYVVFGKAAIGKSGQLNLADLNGSNGFVISGNVGSYSGYSVSNAGDVNNDGIDDLIVGAYGSTGGSYVVFGGATVGKNGQIKVSELNGSNGFAINSDDQRDQLGYSVSQAGDVNGDGIDDLIIGAPLADPNGKSNAGKSYIVFGGATLGNSGQLNLANLNGSNGFVINGINSNDHLGTIVSNAGDINNDNIDDLIIGAADILDLNTLDPIGKSYVIFGKTTLGSSSQFDLATLNGSNGFIINGGEDFSGFSASKAGDINNDGIDDLVIGTDSRDSFGRDNAGTSHVVFGGPNVGSSGRLNLNDFFDDANLTLIGVDEYNYSGSSVSNAGDINNDGIDDLVIGSIYADRYVVFGGANTVASIDAKDDFATVTAGRSVNIDFLSNDIGDTLNFSLFSYRSQNGTAVINNNGTINTPSDDFITYTPNPGFKGTDTLRYGISDGKGQDSDTATITITVLGPDTTGDSGNNDLVGTDYIDTFDGRGGNDTLTGKKGNDSLTGGGDQDTFIFNQGDGTDLITDFSGVGKGNQPSAAIQAEVDVLKFNGASLTARNLLLKQVGSDLEVSFEGVADTKVVLQNLKLENLDNLLKATGANANIGNILFDGDTSIKDSFDVFNSDANPSQVFKKNAVTFLNDRNNSVKGFEEGDDVINAQHGNDYLNGLGGDDLLRGGSGSDRLQGNRGDDVLVGGDDADTFVFNSGKPFTASDLGSDTIRDFVSGSDKILLDKSTFSQLSSLAGNGLAVGEFAKVRSDGAAASSEALIVYNYANGKLFYNANRAQTGLGTGAKFAVLSGLPDLYRSDFVVQA